MTVSITARLRALEAAQPPRVDHFVLTAPGESAESALRRCGFGPERLPSFMLVLPRKRALEEASDGKP